MSGNAVGRRRAVYCSCPRPLTTNRFFASHSVRRDCSRCPANVRRSSFLHSIRARLHPLVLPPSQSALRRGGHAFAAAPSRNGGAERNDGDVCSSKKRPEGPREPTNLPIRRTRSVLSATVHRCSIFAALRYVIASQRLIEGAYVGAWGKCAN